jgi:NADH:ubiquinone oxidoreductase subunit 6 (subunit J)
VAIPPTVPFIGLTWDDVLFVIFATIMIGTALLVVTMRDIIRCGLAMMVSFAGLAGLYVLLGTSLMAAAQVLVYIGAISVLILFAIMLTQSKSAPARLVFQTQAVAAAVLAVVLVILMTITVTATDWGEVGERLRTATDQLATILFNEYQRVRPAVRGRQRAAAGGGDRRSVPCAAGTRTG